MVVPPDLDRLRAWADWNDQDPYSTGGPAEEAARFLLSLAESGGRLVVETPCEHEELEEHYLCDSDTTLHDARNFTCVCPGGSRMQVWPAGREEQ